MEEQNNNRENIKRKRRPEGAVIETEGTVRHRRRRPEGTLAEDDGTVKRRRRKPEGMAAATGTESIKKRRTQGAGSSELVRRREASAKARRARELKKKKQRRKVIAGFVVVLLVLVAAGVGAAYALGVFTNPLDTGTQQLKSGDYKEAVTSFEKAVKDKDKAAEGYQGLGMANWELKDYTACKEAYSKALEAGAKETGIIYNFMALCDMQAEDYDSALSNIAAALDLDGNSAELIQELKYNQIVCYEKQQNWESAKSKMTEYTKEYPDDETAAREAQFLETR